MISALGIVVLFLLSYSLAEPTIFELQNGETSGTLVPTATLEESEYPQVFYKLWVPENTQSLSLIFKQTDSVCTRDIRYYIHADHIPCGTKWSKNSTEEYPCRNSLNDYFTDIAFETVDLYPGPDAGSTRLKLGSYVYISMSRDIPSDYPYQCTYNITVTLNTCNSGLGVVESSSTSVCKPHTTVTLPYNSTFNVSEQLTESYYRLAVPDSVAYIHAHINNASASSYLYANPSFPGGDYYYTSYGVSEYNEADSYSLDLYIYNPPIGYCYLYLYTYYSGYYLQGDLTITFKTCDDSEAGYNCTYQAYNMTNGLNTTTYSIQPMEGGSTTDAKYSDGFKAFYINVDNSTMPFNFSATLLSGSTAIVYYRSNGYIADYSDYYLFYEGLSMNIPTRICITWYDIIVGGRFMMFVSNEGSDVVSFNASLVSSRSNDGSTSTSGSTTGSSGTTSSLTTGSSDSTIGSTSTTSVSTGTTGSSGSVTTGSTTSSTGTIGTTTGTSGNSTTGYNIIIINNYYISSASSVFASFILTAIALIALI